MNLVRFVDYLPPFQRVRYGLGSAFYYLSKEQARLGINVHVICKRRSNEKRFEEFEGIQIHRVVAPYNISALYELIKLNRRIKVDLVHAHATSCPSYAILRRLLPSNYMKAKYVVHVHGTTKGVMLAYNNFIPEVFNEMGLKQRIDEYRSNLRKNLMWTVADALVAVSGSLAEEIENLYDIPRERIHVVYNGVNLEMFHPRQSRNVVLRRHGLDQDSFVILYLGGFRPVKGPTYLIEALGKVYSELKGVKVLFVGNVKDPLQSFFVKPVMDLIRRLRVNDAVRIIESVPYSQMPEYYSAADTMVLPSVYDACPKAVLEAMACGTCVIASSVGGLPELIRNGKNGILVKPGDVDELAEAVANIVSDADLRKKLAAKARRLVEGQFTWAHAAERTLRIYRKLIGSFDEK